MVASIVPIVRIRRATTWWDYSVPRGMTLKPGQLVTIPWRSKTVSGIVWEVQATTANTPTESVIASLCDIPLITLPTRSAWEWLSLATAQSLSTIAYVAMPKALRTTLSPTAKRLLAEITTNNSPRKQTLILQPAAYQNTVQAMGLHSDDSTICWCFGQTNPHHELSDWLRIATGAAQTIFGRERGVLTSFANLTTVVVQNPEDVSYYSETTPYLSWVEYSGMLTKTWRATWQVQSSLPKEINQKLYPQAVIAPITYQATITIATPVKHQLLPDTVAAAIDSNQRVTIILNRHDRLRPGKEAIAGVETLRQQVIMPGMKNVLVGTRSHLHQISGTTRDLAVLIDPPKSDALSFADEFHAWADLCFLIRTHKQVIIQTRNADDPAIHALRNASFTEYLQTRLSERETLQAPPLCTMIAVSIPSETTQAASVDQICDTIRSSCPPEWRIGSPLPTIRRKKAVTVITIYHPNIGQILPTTLYTALAKLPHPWRIERNPWYIL
jgi:primosomal protein N'